MATNYHEYRAAQIRDGMLFQDFVVDLAYQHGLVIAQYASREYQMSVGESRTGVEIKHDKRMKETGNLCIETAEKAIPRPGPYAPSGIMRMDHWLYAIGDYDTVFFLPSNILRALAGIEKYRKYETPTSQGFLLPVENGRKYAAFVLTPSAGSMVSDLVRDVADIARELHAALKDPSREKQLSLF